jgi:hypothetical protein
MMSEEVATSVEQAQAAPAPADVTTKLEDPNAQTAPETPAVEAQAKPDGEQPPETTDEKRKRPPGSERLKRRLALIETEFEQVARENEELRRRTAGDPQEGKPGVDRAPTEKDFPNDYLAFEAARTEWNVRQAVRQELGKTEVQKRDTQLREIRQERVEAYEENVTQVRERIPDFDKVLAEAKAVNISPALADEIMSSDKSALLQYHLAKNPDKARELNALSGRELAREIGRLEARVHLPTPKKATEAAPPPTEVRGRAASSVDPQTGPDDMNAYVEWARKQRAKAS